MLKKDSSSSWDRSTRTRIHLGLGSLSSSSRPLILKEETVLKKVSSSSWEHQD